MISSAGPYFLLQDHLAGIVDNGTPTFPSPTHQDNEMRHLIAPSSMLEVARPRPLHRHRKGTRTHHPSVSRSRRDTPLFQSGPSQAGQIGMRLSTQLSRPAIDRKVSKGQLSASVYSGVTAGERRFRSFV